MTKNINAETETKHTFHKIGGTGGSFKSGEQRQKTAQTKTSPKPTSKYQKNSLILILKTSYGEKNTSTDRPGREVESMQMSKCQTHLFFVLFQVLLKKFFVHQKCRVRELAIRKFWPHRQTPVKFSSSCSLQQAFLICYYDLGIWD